MIQNWFFLEVLCFFSHTTQLNHNYSLHKSIDLRDFLIKIETYEEIEKNNLNKQVHPICLTQEHYNAYQPRYF